MHGFRLADLCVRFSWRDLLVMVRRWSDEPGTALGEVTHGHVLWETGDHLLAAVVDAVQIGNWQRAGKKSLPKPKPVQRPGSKGKTKTIGSDPIPISQFNDWWDSMSKK